MIDLSSKLPANPIQRDVPASKAGEQLGAMLLKQLRQTHPRHNPGRVQMLKALYRGGHALLQNADILNEVFPKYVHENDMVYAERKRRAFYENVFALVINQIVAGLAQDPAKYDQAPIPIDGQVDDKGQPVVEQVEIDEYWASILEDATASSEDGSTMRSLDQVARDVCCEALVTGMGWIQCDLPGTTNPSDINYVQPFSLAEQEELGSLRAYVVPWPTECVIDWQEKGGRLLWVKTYECGAEALTANASRQNKKHVWTVWDPEGWTRYEVESGPQKPMPNDESMIGVASRGTHSFGRTPFVRLDLSSGRGFGTHLHVGDLIESLCRSYFNRQNGESFQWTQYNFQQLYEFLGPEISGVDTMVSEAQTDVSRAKRTRAPGQVHVRGAGDKAEFVGPNMGGADVGQKANDALRDSIFRSTASMALSQDTSGAMLGRSADSKKQDAVAQEILLGAIGKILLVFVRHVLNLLACGRAGLNGDPEDPPRAIGYESFDVDDVTTVINNAVLADGISVPSATYQIEAKYQMAIKHLGDSIDPAKKSLIYKELTSVFTQDQVIAQHQAANAPPPDPSAEGEDPSE